MNNSQEIIKFDKIDSTHKYLKNNYKNYKSGTVIIAETQTGGIGTHGRVWYTGKNNIAMSMLFKPNCKVKDLEGLTIKIAVTIKNIIKDLYNIELIIKEPNDLILNNKKISGILTEINTIGKNINYLIISIGFNVNEVEFIDELKEIATSLKREYSNQKFDKEKLIDNFIYGIKDMIDMYE